MIFIQFLAVFTVSVSAFDSISPRLIIERNQLCHANTKRFTFPGHRHSSAFYFHERSFQLQYRNSDSLREKEQDRTAIDTIPYPVLGVFFVVLFYFTLPIIFPRSAGLLASKLASSLLLSLVLFGILLQLKQATELPDVANRGLVKIANAVNFSFEEGRPYLIPWPITLIGVLVLLFFYAGNMISLALRVVGSFFLLAVLTQLLTVLARLKFYDISNTSII